MKRILVVIAFFIMIPICSNAQEASEQVVDENSVIDVRDEGAAVGFEGDPAMPSQAEMEKIREESGYNDFVAGSDTLNKDPECFDYYTFQSVQVSIGTEKDLFEPGETVKLAGQVINENDYPVVDGNVFVRVSQRNGNYQEEGNFIIDEFIAVENISIDKSGTKDISFEWVVPESAPASTYIFDYFFSVGKKFNLGGLPFSNEIVIGQSTFRVVTKQTSSISFNRSETKVNNETYQHIGGWPSVLAGEKVVITQPIINSFTENKDVDITYELYYWDSLNKADLLDTKKEKIVIPANDSVNLEYTIPEMNDSVYYLKMIATSGDSQSIVNIRVVSNQSHPRLNYPAITKFPLNKGDDVTLFTCFHNTSGINTQGKVVVTLKDEDGVEVSRIDYDGTISSIMVADKTQFTAQKSYDHLVLHAQIYDYDGQLVDEYEANYNCEDFKACGKNSQSNKGVVLDNMKYVLFGLSILLFVGVLIFLGVKSYKQK